MVLVNLGVLEVSWWLCIDGRMRSVRAFKPGGRQRDFLHDDTALCVQRQVLELGRKPCIDGVLRTSQILQLLMVELSG